MAASVRIGSMTKQLELPTEATSGLQKKMTMRKRKEAESASEFEVIVEQQQSSSKNRPYEIIQ